MVHTQCCQSMSVLFFSRQKSIDPEVREALRWPYVRGKRGCRKENDSLCMNNVHDFQHTSERLSRHLVEFGGGCNKDAARAKRTAGGDINHAQPRPVHTHTDAAGPTQCNTNRPPALTGGGEPSLSPSLLVHPPVSTLRLWASAELLASLDDTSVQLVQTSITITPRYFWLQFQNRRFAKQDLPPRIYQHLSNTFFKPCVTTFHKPLHDWLLTHCMQIRCSWLFVQRWLAGLNPPLWWCCHGDLWPIITVLVPSFNTCFRDMMNAGCMFGLDLHLCGVLSPTPPKFWPILKWMKVATD